MQDWALKYRPQRLEDLVGQEVNKEILSKLVAEDRLFNTMIFYGRSGCGKTTTARILVNELDAELIELDGASNNSVNDARIIKEIASRLALTGRKKIIVIDEAHMLSKSAWNALLKVIEEPNEKTYFIFCTTEYGAIPTTIKGRSQMFKFYSIPYEVSKKYAKEILEKENLSLDSEAIDLVLKESKGQVRDLLKLLQVSAENRLNTVEKLSKFLAIPDTRGMGSFLESVLANNSRNAIRVLKGLETDYIEWKDRLEQLIYEILEDYYKISTLNYSIAQTASLRKLGQAYKVQDYGVILDYLLTIDKADTAYQKLYVLATLGVEGVRNANI